MSDTEKLVEAIGVSEQCKFQQNLDRIRRKQVFVRRLDMDLSA